MFSLASFWLVYIFWGNVFDLLNGMSQWGPDNSSQIRTMSDIAGIILNVALGIALSLSTIAIVIGGIQYVTSSGDPKETERAQNTLKYAVMGLVLALGAFTVRFIILDLLGATGNVRDTIPGI